VKGQIIHTHTTIDLLIIRATSCTIEVLFIFYRAIDFFSQKLYFLKYSLFASITPDVHMCNIIADRVS